MPLRHFSVTDSCESIVAELRNNGVAVIDRLIDDAVLDALGGEIQPHIDAEPVGGGAFFGGAMKRVKEVAARAPSAADIFCHPVLTTLADAILLENCKSYRVQILIVLDVCHGGQLQPLHRDIGVYEPYLNHEPGAKEILLSWIVALTDFTEDNGATRVVPGSQRWTRERVATDRDIAIAAMRRGSALVFLGSVLHGAGVNTTARPRTGVVSGYAVGWLRQEENQYLSCPPDAAMRLSKQAQQLLGYRAHTPILGHSGERDHDWLLGPPKPNTEGEGYEEQSLQ